MNFGYWDFTYYLGFEVRNFPARILMYMSYLKVYLNPQKEAGIAKKRHPWLFSHAIEKPQNLENGSLCDVFFSNKKTFFGRGYFNKFSQISVRLLTRDQNENIDQKFLEKRLTELKEIRERFIDTSSTNAYRLVFGESDSMPGLVLDKYNKTYVIQIHTAGMEKLKPLVVEAVKKIFNPETLYERSDVNVRLLEGLKECPRGHLYGKKLTGEIEILENGIPLLVDNVNGQKTGLFLDQRENRKALQKYSAGKKILNCFCYTAGFSVYAALAGASSTTNIDVSKDALETAKRNFTLNKLDIKKHEFIDEDVFDYLEKCKNPANQFDLIILDPPAFVKNKKTLSSGLSGYLHINERALRILPRNGVLITSSCSAFVTDELFQNMLIQASHKANCTLKMLEIKHQPIDHPFNLDFPEGKYLKFYVMLKT